MLLWNITTLSFRECERVKQTQLAVEVYLAQAVSVNVLDMVLDMVLDIVLDIVLDMVLDIVLDTVLESDLVLVQGRVLDPGWEFDQG